MTKLFLLLFAGVKLGKIGLSLGSMLVSIWAYAQLFGWKFAAGFVGMMFIHEAGHYVAARQRNLDVSLPAFIPFMGAFINLRQQPHDAETEAYVAYAGPFVGTLGAFAAYFWGRETGNEMWIALAYAGFMLNLFNLIPISPLDGGRITQILSPRIWFVGFPMLVALFLWRPSPLLVVIEVLALPSLAAAWRHDSQSPEAAAYHEDISPQTKAEYTLMYLGLTALLALMSYAVHESLTHG